MLQAQKDSQRVNVRDFQHNLSKHLIKAKNNPLIITKFGKEELIVADPETYELKKKTPRKYLTLNHEFFGMHKNGKDWKGKTSARITEDLRKAAWYGQKMPN